jgi:hypothetical protein
MNNARASVRYEVRVSAEVTLSPGVSVSCVTRDLSVGGVGIEADRVLPDGQRVEVELFIVVDDIEDEATTPLVLTGKIAWCRPLGELQYLAGIQFVDLDAARTEYLAKLLRAIPQQKGTTAPAGSPPVPRR